MANEGPNETKEAPQAKVVAPVPRKRKAMRAYLLLAGLAGVALAVYFIHGYMTRNEVSTDDAQIDADVLPISSRVLGVVAHMDVVDNQRVAAGAPLAELDDEDFKAKVESAQADLDAALEQADAADAQVDIVRSTSTGGLSSAQAQVRGMGASVRTAAAQVESAQAAVARAKADLDKAQSDYNRDKKLYAEGAVSGQTLENAKAARESAQASLDLANANLTGARDQKAAAESRVAEAAGRLEQSAPVNRQIAVAVAAAKLAHSHVASAQSALKLAKLQLGYTRIVAPVAGYVSKLGVHEGQMVQPGMTMLMIVPVQTYVVANFKETQLERIRPGDPVDVSIDALGGTTLHGQVDSIAAGTGARFSMMPPENATGNFVKVVQRVPVKIVWTKDQPELDQLHAGLSVEVKVHLQH